MELINNKIEQEKEVNQNFRAISKGQKFEKIDVNKSVSDEEKAFYEISKNSGKTFISKNRIY